MTAVERYNALDGTTVARGELFEVLTLAKNQGQMIISERIADMLEDFEDPEFHITIGHTAIDSVPEDCLAGLDCIVPDEEFTGLEKAVSPDDIYQMITDKMLAQLKEATGKGYKSKWKKQNEEGYLIPFNFESKKQYRGINFALLTEGMSKILKNPYFLTFKQIEKNKGKLNKGSKGLPVVYFTMLYSVSELNNGVKIEFGTYNKAKYFAWLTKNIGRLQFTMEYYKNKYIPILKYYNLFNGADVTGIDFKLENFKIGFQSGGETIKNNDPRVEIADLIVKNYPSPQPVLKDSKNGRAYYSHTITGSVDSVNMPKFEDFDTGLDYYRTLLHEFTHSTGINSRLKREMGGKFGSPKYAKEELVAEFGAVFLSAHAGIIWHNQSNHAEYLKNWNNALTHIKDDNRFIMRAASKAQAAADFVLNLDKDGIPTYQNSLISERQKKEAKKPAVTSKTALLDKATKKEAVTKKTKPPVARKRKSKQLKMALAAPWHDGAAKEALSSCGRLKKGYKYVKGGKIEKVEKKQPAKKVVKKKTKAELEKANPKGFDKKPKSVAVATAIKNILGLDKFKDVNVPLATLLHKYFKNFDKLKFDGYGFSEEFFGIDSGYEEGILFKESIYHDIVNSNLSITEIGFELVTAIKNRIESLRNQKTNLALFDGLKGTTINSDIFKNMKVGELRKFTLHYYNQNLKGNKVAIKNALKEVSLVSNAGKKIAVGGAMYKEKAAVISHLEELIKNSTYNNWGDRKENKDESLLGYLNFKSKLIIDGTKRHVRISIALKKDRKTELKNFEVGKKEDSEKSSKVRTKRSPQVGEDISPSKNKDTKKTNTPKKGLKSPVEVPPIPIAVATAEPEVITPAYIEPEPILREEPTRAKNLAAAMQDTTQNEVFNIPGDIGLFLGQVEKKPVHSVVTTIDAEQGAGKTRLVFQIMNALAGMGMKCLFYSLEEHPQSKLFKDKVNQYIDPSNLANISVIDEVVSWENEKALIEASDAIFFDSFQKLPKIDLDRDIRKAFNSKLFYVIYQQTGTKTMRGGSEAAFDGDQILKIKKHDNYKENYAFANKNRYQNDPEIKFNIYKGELVRDKEPGVEEFMNSRAPDNTGGRLIATPMF